MSMAGIAMTSSLTPCITPSGNRPPGLQAPKVGCAGARSPAMLGRLGAARCGRLPGLTGRGASSCAMSMERVREEHSGRATPRRPAPRCSTSPAHSLRWGCAWGHYGPGNHADATACAGRQGRRARVGRWMPLRSHDQDHRLPWSLSATQSPWACLVVSSGGHAHLSERTGTMARSAKDIRLTGIDMHQGAPAPEPPRVPRISLTFSGLPPADGHTILTRERGVARQTLGREARIEDSYLLTDGGPDDRDQHHRDSFQ